MASAIETLEFTVEEGGNRDHALTIYALSTCAFCKRAIEFLRGQDVGFRYIYLDKIDPSVKTRVKSELKQKYDNIPVFPVLVIDDQRALSGFNQNRWQAELGLDQIPPQ